MATEVIMIVRSLFWRRIESDRIPVNKIPIIAPEKKYCGILLM